MPTISALHYYPIKSCAGHAITEAQLTPRGIKHDREFVLTEPDGMFLTQREYPRMALIEPKVTDTTLTVDAPDMPTLQIDIQQEGPTQETVVWRSVCDTVDQGQDVAAWFSQYLGIDCRLQRMHNDFVRKVDPDFAKRENDQVSFADGYPFLLISEASLADLNQRLAESLPMNRFRPNIVVNECRAFAEDYWEKISISDVKFDVVKACARCTVTTVNQATAETSKEPLKTLATFRNRDGGVMFGQNLLHDHSGTIKVGDSIEIVR